MHGAGVWVSAGYLNVMIEQLFKRFSLSHAVVVAAVLSMTNSSSSGTHRASAANVLRCYADMISVLLAE